MTAPLIKGASGLEGDALTTSNINENKKDIFTFTANESVTWSISGGEKSLFVIDEITGQLSFKELPDYEQTFSLNGTTLAFSTNYSSQAVASNFFVELYNSENIYNNSTPITANNFIQYVNDSSYDNTLIHRLSSNFVIQSGGYKWPSEPSNQEGGSPIRVSSKGAITNEPGNSNNLGTIAMAKVADNPDSASSEWFINLTDNKNLDSQNGGFSVFGHILGDGIYNPLLLNNQTIYNVNYADVDLNLSQLPLLNLQGNIIYDTNYFAIHSIATIDERPSQIANNYNVIVTATDLDGNQSNQYVIVDVNDVKGEILTGGDGIDTFNGGLGNDIFQGNGGNDTIDGGANYDIAKYSGNFSDYEITYMTLLGKVIVSDTFTSNTDGIDVLANIEKLSFLDKEALITSKEIKPITSLGFQSEKVYIGKSDTYKFYNLGSDNFGVGTSSGIDELTGSSLLIFDDKSLHLINDIKATFDQVTALNDPSAEMFRLYNAAFARFPDADGLKYWIDNFTSGKDDSRAVASSFIVSEEFKQRYGENVSNSKYVETLYINVLGRDYDQAGYNYWLGNLNNGIETRYELLLGFSESLENKGLFSEMTGLY